MIFPEVLIRCAVLALTTPQEVMNYHEIAQLGLGYLIVLTILVPLVKWLMATMSKQAESRDELLSALIKKSEASTEAMNALTSRIHRFVEEDRSSHAKLVETQNRLLDSLSTIERTLSKNT